MAHFFIDRPIFAWVIAIILMLAGVMAIRQLPIEQYPDIAPPQVTISATYPGASAKVVEDAVTQILEQGIRGVDGLLYMSSSSSSAGTASINLTFASGTDPDIAQVQVQNKLQAVTPLLPQEVQQQGVTVGKGRSGFLMVLGFISEDGSMSNDEIGDYITSNIVDRIARLPGVGGTQQFGTQFAMRIWLDPGKLDTYGLTVAEITAAIKAQNAQVTLGQLGAAPAISGQQLNATISAQSRLNTPEQFRNIILRSQVDGSRLTLGDVARVELGAQSYDAISRYNGQPASGMAVTLATGANALDTADRVRAELARIESTFPAGLTWEVPFDTTPFVRVSINGVVKTLLEAVGLVFVVMFLFLGNLRATVIPTLAVPVVLLGTFAMLYTLGFTINMLTMFAMVLAIGLLVDDAIVVVENVERLMHEEGLSPKEAAKKSMTQITGALVGIVVVLSAVFVPMGFMGGSTGTIYLQFTATIVIAMGFSLLVAIVLTPALCATMLKPAHSHDGQPRRRGLIRRFLDWFNRSFDRGSAHYQRGVLGMLKRPWRFMLLFVLISAGAGWMFMKLPTGFLPEEDQGMIMVMVQAPPGATQERTLESMKQLEQYFLENEKEDVISVFTVTGFSFSGQGQNMGMAFVRLRDWSLRTTVESKVPAMVGRAFMGLGQIQDAFMYPMAPPAIMGLGNSSGFSFYLTDNGGSGHEGLLAAQGQFLGMAAAEDQKYITGVRPNGMQDAPELRVVIDQQKAQALGLSPATINSTLATAWGGSYIDDFIDRSRVKRVYLQADAPFRMVPEDFLRWSVRNDAGQMVPFSAFASSHWEYGSPSLQRYNGIGAMELQGAPMPGVSSGDAMAEVERLVAQLPEGIGMEWTAASYQEREAGGQIVMLYTLSLLIVFLCLAALYESWSVPTAVLLVVPLGVLGAALFTGLRGLDRDVYFQVGLLTTVGLTSKNAVLIIEFAKQYYEQGTDLIKAIMMAVRDRLRPIVMTSLAFGFGVLPLALASGAGSAAQRAIGTGVLGGMIVGTLLGVFFIPLFYMVVVRLFAGRKAAPAETGVSSHA